jgi:TnpA family transposase
MLYSKKDAMREAISRVVNATFAARLPETWGQKCRYARDAFRPS